MEPQDPAEDLEDQLLQVGDEAEDRLALLAQRLHREAHEQADEQDLEDGAGDERAEEGVRDNALDELRQAAGFARFFGIFRASRRIRVEAETFARLDQVAHTQADSQSDGGHDDEVDQGQATGLAHRRGGADGTDAEDDGAEDDRADNHLDQRDERVADRLELHCEVRGNETKGDASDHGNDDANVEPVGVIFALLRLSDLGAG